jgi:SAM-dependent methyltransferase
MSEAGQFHSPAEHYDRFMGRYTPSLAAALVDAVGVAEGQRVLDVGCGPGGLTAELVACTGAERVAAIDPAAQFVAACAARNPGVDAREGVAEELPWEDGAFDAVLSCLVIAFMRDADRGVREMARVTRPRGTVAICMWDIAGGGMTMLRIFWSVMRELHPAVPGEQRRPGTREGDIADRLERAGLTDVTGGGLNAHAEYSGFDDFWDPFTLAVGPAGQALASLAPDDRAVVREGCRALVPEGAFSLEARAWYAIGTVT